MNMSSSASHEPVYVPMDAIQNQYVYIQPAQTSPVSILSIQNPAPTYPDNYLAADEIAISGVKKRKSRTVVHEKWSKEEDKRLSDAVKKYGAKNWKKIASEVGGSRNDVQCLHRWRKVISPELVKGPWTPDEDMIIMKAVRDAGDVNNIKWCEVAAKLKGRIGKQCRERYLNYLDQNIKKSEWTEEEDKILFELQRVIGNRWCEIAKVLPGRSENNIKNRFNSKAKATYLLHHRTPMIPIQNLCTASPDDDPRQPRKKRKLMCPPLQQLLRYLNLSSQMLDSIIPPLPVSSFVSPNNTTTTLSSINNNDIPIPDNMYNINNNNNSTAPALLPLSSSSNRNQLGNNNNNNNLYGGNNEEDELNLLTKPTLTIVDQQQQQQQPFNITDNNNIINNNNDHINNCGYNIRSTRSNNYNNNTIGVSTRSRSRNNNNNNTSYSGFYTGKYSSGRTTRSTRNSTAAATAERQRKQKEMKLQKQQQQQQQQQLQQQLQLQQQQQQQEYFDQQQYPQFLYYFQPFIPSYALNTYESGIYNEYEISDQQPPHVTQLSQPPHVTQLNQPQPLDEFDNENPSSIMFQNNIYMSNFSTNNNINNNANLLNNNLNNNNNNIFIQSMDDSTNSTISNLMMLNDSSNSVGGVNIEEDEEVRMYLNENGRYNDPLNPIPSFIEDPTIATITTTNTIKTISSDDLNVLLNNSSSSLVNNNNNSITTD